MPTENNVGPAFSDTKASSPLPRDAPEGIVDDPSYKTGKNDEASVPVVDDTEPLPEAYQDGEADSDKQLERDEKEALDQDNVIKERTRHAKPTGTYQEPSDEQMGLME
ncbi:hypothetical protein QBC35DRAFT_525564 [Podospora australis]|uniref:Histone chaperone domain-containing protein n=1 Tax=Podospora australis TaxID=1536484 RepID=A0AAN7AF63_9PEZI|nr:hypothetical protein QBC35DRAFT_525564 [Podospora australis]